MRLSSILSNGILKTSTDGVPTTPLGRLFQRMVALNVKIPSFYQDEPSSSTTGTHWHLFSVWLLVEREPPSSLKPPFKYWDSDMRP